LPDRVPTGHKLALAPVAAGEKVVKYGSPIGSATRDIQPGEYVHLHNLRSDYLPTYTLDGSNPFLREAGEP
jgi:altronate dehydratase